MARIGLGSFQGSIRDTVHSSPSGLEDTAGEGVGSHDCQGCLVIKSLQQGGAWAFPSLASSWRSQIACFSEGCLRYPGRVALVRLTGLSVEASFGEVSHRTHAGIMIQRWSVCELLVEVVAALASPWRGSRCLPGRATVLTRIALVRLSHDRGASYVVRDAKVARMERSKACISDVWPRRCSQRGCGKLLIAFGLERFTGSCVPRVPH